MNSDSRTKTRAKRAYTLVELVAVIVLVAVMAASTAPMMGTIANARRSATLDALRSDIAYARAHAIATGMRTWTDIDIQQNTWQLLAEPPSAAGHADALPINASLTATQAGSTDNLPNHADADIETADFDGHTIIGFDRLGRPLTITLQPLTNPGIARIHLAGAVRIEPITGHVRIIE